VFGGLIASAKVPLPLSLDKSVGGARRVRVGLRRLVQQPNQFAEREGLSRALGRAHVVGLVLVHNPVRDLGACAPSQYSDDVGRDRRQVDTCDLHLIRLELRKVLAAHECRVQCPKLGTDLFG